MRAEIIHVTDHALLRWKQRVSKTEQADATEIIKSVKDSKLIEKKEPLPYSTPRRNGSVYSFNSGILFILESVTIDEYRLITLISEGITRKVAEDEDDIPVFKELPFFENFNEEREWLVEEKRKIESILATTAKKTKRSY